MPLVYIPGEQVTGLPPGVRCTFGHPEPDDWTATEGCDATSEAGDAEPGQPNGSGITPPCES